MTPQPLTKEVLSAALQQGDEQLQEVLRGPSASPYQRREQVQRVELALRILRRHADEFREDDRKRIIAATRLVLDEAKKNVEEELRAAAVDQIEKLQEEQKEVLAARGSVLEQERALSYQWYRPSTWSPEAQQVGMIAGGAAIASVAIGWIINRISRTAERVGHGASTVFSWLKWTAGLTLVGVGVLVGVSKWEELKKVLEGVGKVREEAAKIAEDAKKKTEAAVKGAQAKFEATKNELEKARLDMEKRQKGVNEVAEAGVENATRDLIATGLLFMHKNRAEETGCTSRALKALLARLDIQRRLTVGDLRTLSLDALAQRFGIQDATQRQVLDFLKRVCEDQAPLVQGLLERRPGAPRDPAAIERQLNALTLQDFLQQGGQVATMFARIGAAMERQGRTSFAAVNVQAVMNAGFGCDAFQEIIRSPSFQERIRRLQVEGLDMSNPDVQTRFLAFCIRWDDAPITDLSQNADNDEQRKFVQLLEKLGAEVQRSKGYIMLSTHGHRRGQGGKASADFLESRFKALSLKDALQLYAYLGLAGNFEGGEYPQSIDEKTHPLGAVLLQMKVLQMVAEQAEQDTDKEQGIAFRDFLIVEGIAGAAGHNTRLALPPKTMEILSKIFTTTARWALFAALASVNNAVTEISHGLEAVTPISADVWRWALYGYAGNKVVLRPLIVHTAMRRITRVERLLKLLGQHGIDVADFKTPTWWRRRYREIPGIGLWDEWRVAGRVIADVPGHLAALSPEQLARALEALKGAGFSAHETVLMLREVGRDIDYITKALKTAGWPVDDVARGLRACGAANNADEMARLLRATGFDKVDDIARALRAAQFDKVDDCVRALRAIGFTSADDLARGLRAFGVRTADELRALLRAANIADADKIVSAFPRVALGAPVLPGASPPPPTGAQPIPPKAGPGAPTPPPGAPAQAPKPTTTMAPAVAPGVTPSGPALPEVARPSSRLWRFARVGGRVFFIGGAALGTVAETVSGVSQVGEHIDLVARRKQLAEELRTIFGDTAKFAATGRPNVYRELQSGIEIDITPIFQLSDDLIRSGALHIGATTTSILSGLAMFLASSGIAAPLAVLAIAGVPLMRERIDAAQREKIRLFLCNIDQRIAMLLPMDALTGSDPALLYRDILNIRAIWGHAPGTSGAEYQRSERAFPVAFAGMVYREALAMCPVHPRELSLDVDGPSHLDEAFWGMREEIARRIRDFAGDDPTPERLQAAVHRAARVMLVRGMFRVYARLREACATYDSILAQQAAGTPTEDRVKSAGIVVGSMLANRTYANRVRARMELLGQQYFWDGKTIADAFVQHGTEPAGVDFFEGPRNLDRTPPSRILSMLRHGTDETLLSIHPNLEQLSESTESFLEQLGAQRVIVWLQNGKRESLPIDAPAARDRQGTVAYQPARSGVYVYFAIVGGCLMWSSWDNPGWQPIERGRYGEAAGGAMAYMNTVASLLTRVSSELARPPVAAPSHPLLSLRPPERAPSSPARDAGFRFLGSITASNVEGGSSVKIAEEKKREMEQPFSAGYMPPVQVPLSPRGAPPFERTAVDANVIRIRVGGRTVEFGCVGNVWMWRNPPESSDRRWYLLNENRFAAGVSGETDALNTIAHFLGIINREGGVPAIGGVDRVELYWSGDQLRSAGIVAAPQLPPELKPAPGALFLRPQPDSPPAELP